MTSEVPSRPFCSSVVGLVTLDSEKVKYHYLSCLPSTVSTDVNILLSILPRHGSGDIATSYFSYFLTCKIMITTLFKVV